MKKITLNESQFRKLLEAETAPTFDNGDVKEYNSDAEISTTAPVHDENGEYKYGKQHDTDELGDFLTLQNYWANAQNGARVMP
jgi:hypothetical protein